MTNLKMVITEEGRVIETKEFETVATLKNYLTEEFDRLTGWIEEEDELVETAREELEAIETEEDAREFTIDMSYWTLEVK